MFLKHSYIMKKIFNSWLTCGAIGLVALALTAACTDDHFEVKNDAAGRQTLWQNIESNPDLSAFASILKRTKVMKEENDRNTSITVAQLLDQPQSFTLWAPVNGTFSAKDWEDLLSQADELRAKGTPADLLAARALDYRVWNQFASNHIARFNHEGASGVQDIKLLNGKNTRYDVKAFSNVPVEGSPINASNGSLHLLQGAAPFAYNIYDYLSHHSGFKAINTYVKDPSIDQRKFDENRSVAGAMNEQGQMVYIDSVYTHTNELLDRTGAYISNEDSTYVALIPNDHAWQEALTTVSKIYNYGVRYKYDWNGGELTKENRLDRPTHSGGMTLADSIRERNVRLDIVQNMFFAPYRIKGYETMDSAALIHHVLYADSLISTAGTTFYNVAAVKTNAAENTHLNPTLAGLTPYRASNGYVFELNNYNFDPSYIWVKKSELTPWGANLLGTNNTSYDRGSLVVLNEGNYNRERPSLDANGDTIRTADGKPVMIGVSGKLENNQYQRFDMKSDRSNMSIDFRLENLYSAAYQIEVVMVPTKINLDDGGEDEKVVFYAEVFDDYKNPIPFTVNGNKENRFIVDQSLGQFAPNKVNNVILGDYITIPKCYYGLPADRSSFVTLRLTLPRIGSRGNTNCRALNIAKVIIKPYRGN